MSRNKTIIVVTATIIIITAGLSGCIDRSGKHVTHLGVGLGVLEEDGIKVFYRRTSPIQKSLAEQSLNIIIKQYEICSDVTNLSYEELFPCSMVFCKSRLDPYILRCQWYAYVDGILCWPVIGEKTMEFEKPINEWMLYHLLPHEIIDITLRERRMDYVYSAWFIEGVAEYTSLTCANETDQLNATFFLNRVEQALVCFSEQEERIVDLSNRSSFEGFGAPGSEDEYIFYVGSLVYVKNLTNNYGDEFIEDVFAENCKSYEEVRSCIENSTGYNISDSIKSVSVGWIKEQYILLLDELNVNYQ
jgi:hypothetical protein